MKPGIYYFIFLLCILYVSNTQAQNVNCALDSFYVKLAAGGQLNGNVLIAENGKTIYRKSFGYADFETKRLNNETTEFQLASISKTFTAIAILQLYERGKLKLDDTYAKYYPVFPYKSITIRQLLSHSSGLSDQDLAGIFDSFAEKHNGRIPTNDDVVPVIAEANIKLKLSPNVKWWYSNTGYVLLASLVEKLSGEKFDQYIKKHIFKPAKMAHTYLKTAYLHKNMNRDAANNYDYEFMFSNERIKFDGKKSYYNEATYGNSNVISTAGDLLLFDNALYNGRLLKTKTLQAAYTPTRLKNGENNFVWKNLGGMGNANNGLGWFIFEDSTTGKIVWHTGGMPGCATIFLRNITKHQTVILLDNTSSEGLYRSGLAAMNILNHKPLPYVKKSLTKKYGKALMSKGSDYAFRVLQELKSDSTHYNLTENDMNNLGYEFLENGYISQAVESFKVNTLLYPESDNVFNSYGEALLKAGKKDEAILMYKKSLELNPRNEDSSAALKEIQQ